MTTIFYTFYAICFQFDTANEKPWTETINFHTNKLVPQRWRKFTTEMHLYIMLMVPMPMRMPMSIEYDDVKLPYSACTTFCVWTISNDFIIIF